MATLDPETPRTNPEDINLKATDFEDIDTSDDIDTEEPGGGLTADDLAQPTTTGDSTGDRATGLTGLRGG